MWLCLERAKLAKTLQAGASCRYAHGVEELRSNPNFTGPKPRVIWVTPCVISNLESQSCCCGCAFLRHLLLNASCSFPQLSLQVCLELISTCQRPRREWQCGVGLGQALDSCMNHHNLQNTTSGKMTHQNIQLVNWTPDHMISCIYYIYVCMYVM